MPGMADAYDIGVDWENVKDKPDVGSIDVGVTNEVLNIDTNKTITINIIVLDLILFHNSFTLPLLLL